MNPKFTATPSLHLLFRLKKTTSCVVILLQQQVLADQARGGHSSEIWQSYCWWVSGTACVKGELEITVYLCV